MRYTSSYKNTKYIGINNLFVRDCIMFEYLITTLFSNWSLNKVKTNFIVYLLISKILKQ